MYLGFFFFFKFFDNFGGILLNSVKENFEFYDWSVVYFLYCDGLLFLGNRFDLVEFEGLLLYFRGFRILDLIILELLFDISLKEVRNVVFFGIFVGGFVVMFYVDYVCLKFFKYVYFRLFVDLGFFFDIILWKYKK